MTNSSQNNKSSSNDDQKLILKELRELKSSLKSYPVLNGGFDKLASSMEIVKNKQESMEEDIREIRENIKLNNVKFEKITEATEAVKKDFEDIVLDPERGIYSRLKTVETKVTQGNVTFEQHVVDDSEVFQNIGTKLGKILDNQKPLMTSKERLHELTGKNLDELRDIVSMKRNFKKLYWMLAATALVPLLKMIFDAVFHH